MYRWPFAAGDLAPYASDTGDDDMEPVGSPIIAFDDGPLLYSEGVGGCGRAHTPWVRSATCPNDTPGCILQRLSHPIVDQGKTYIEAWYAHLSRLAVCVRDGIDPPYMVKAGMMIGHSGCGRNIPHEHFGLLTDRSQAEGTYMEPMRLKWWLETHVKH